MQRDGVCQQFRRGKRGLRPHPPRPLPPKPPRYLPPDCQVLVVIALPVIVQFLLKSGLFASAHCRHSRRRAARVPQSNLHDPSWLLVQNTCDGGKPPTNGKHALDYTGSIWQAPLCLGQQLTACQTEKLERRNDGQQKQRHSLSCRPEEAAAEQHRSSARSSAQQNPQTDAPLTIRPIDCTCLCTVQNATRKQKLLQHAGRHITPAEAAAAASAASSSY